MATREEIKAALDELLSPSVPLTISKKFANGRKVDYCFQIAFDFNTAALVEKETGFSMLTGEAFDHPSATVISAMLWAGVQQYHTEYEGEDGLRFIRRIMDTVSAKHALEAVQKAWLLSLPDETRQEIERKAAEKIAGKKPKASEPDPTTAV